MMERCKIGQTRRPVRRAITLYANSLEGYLFLTLFPLF